MIVREAQGRADLLLQKAQARLEDIDRDITELRLRRRDVEGSLESSIQALYHALEFIRDQDKQDKPEDKVLIHRPRQAEAPAQPRPASERAARAPRIATSSASTSAAVTIPLSPERGRADLCRPGRPARRPHRHRRRTRRCHPRQARGPSG